MFYYAQIDEQGVCIAVSDLSGEVIADNMIPLESFDTSVSGKKWDGEKWIENPNPPQPQPQPAPVTNEEIKQLQLDTMQGLTDLYMMQLGGK